MDWPEFCFLLPKIELHAHLNGSLSHKALKELSKLNNKEEIIENYGFHQNSKNLTKCFEVFKIAQNLTSNIESVKLATRRVIEDFEKENTVYLELRSTLRVEENMSKEQYLQAIISTIESCKLTSPRIIVKMIVSINRSQPVEHSLENMELAIKYRKLKPEVVVGIDVSGDPSKGDFLDLIEMLKIARDSELKLAVHCGEIVNNKEVEQILQFKPDRLGHCTCIHKDYGGNSKLWIMLLESKIPVELCLTSNILTDTVDCYENHHFKFLKQANHPISLGTDDKGVFSTSLSKEFEITQKTFDLPADLLWFLSYDSIEYSFCDEEERFKLRKLLHQWRRENKQYFHVNVDNQVVR